LSNAFHILLVNANPQTINENTNNLNTTNNKGKQGARAGTVRSPYKPRKSKKK